MPSCLQLKAVRFQRKFNKVGKQRVQRQQQVAWKCNLPLGTVDSSGVSIRVFDRTKPIKLGTDYYNICIFFSVMSNRPLRDGELFEIQIERMVERWSGSIEAGVTLIRQDHCVCTLELRIETAVLEYKMSVIITNPGRRSWTSRTQ